jgi:hypothetical protein
MSALLICLLLSTILFTVLLSKQLCNNLRVLLIIVKVVLPIVFWISAAAFKVPRYLYAQTANSLHRLLFYDANIANLLAILITVIVLAFRHKF